MRNCFLPEKNKISSVKSAFSTLLVLLSPAVYRNTLLIYFGIVLLTSLFSSGRCQHSSIALHTNDDQSLYTNVLINNLAGKNDLLLLNIDLIKSCMIRFLRDTWDYFISYNGGESWSEIQFGTYVCSVLPIPFTSSCTSTACFDYCREVTINPSHHAISTLSCFMPTSRYQDYISLV